MKKVKLTKQNYKSFSKSALFPKKGNPMPSSDSAVKELYTNNELLLECEQYYNSLQLFREERKDCVDYFYGDQLSRQIPDPDGCGTISIHDYAVHQGMVPLKFNIITSRLRSLIGAYSKQKLEDLAVSRTRDEQKLGEMMTVAMQYAYQKGNLYRVNTDGYREFLLSALPCFRTGFDWDNNRKISDVYTELEDIKYMFWDDNTSGQYFQNISVIGKLHEFSMLEILNKFAKTPEMRRQIIDAYDEVKAKYPHEQQFTRDKSNENKISFFVPRLPHKYRVIEVWTKEEDECYVCHDPLADEPYTIDLDQLQEEVINENRRRQQEVVNFGGMPEDAAIIDYEYRVDTKWVVRYLTPCGRVLYKSDSPYAHGSHPWAIGGYPMVDGRVQSLTHDMMSAQDLVNRIVMRNEFIQMNRAKGFGIIDLDVLEDSGMDEVEFAKKYTSAKGIAALRTTKVGGVNQVFHRFNDDGSNPNDFSMLNMCIEIINQQSGSTDASRGEKGHSGESASRYMIETENSANNTCDGEQWYNGLILQRDYKIMSLIQQYYTSVRYINIAGTDYAEESKWYKPEKIQQSLFDLSVIQSASTGSARFAMEDTLKTLFQSQAIDADTWLESTSLHGADKILERKKAHEQEAQEQQMQAQQMAAQQQQAAAAAVPQQPQQVTQQ